MMYCQKCRSPLRLDSSLYDLNPAAFKLLADASLSPETDSLRNKQSSLPSRQHEKQDAYQNALKTSRPATIKQSFLQPHSHSRNPGESFVLLNESQILESPTPKSKSAGKSTSSSSTRRHDYKERTEMAENIFEVLSSRSDIDHPICNECTQILIEGLERRLVQTKKERDAYIDFLRQANADTPSEEEVKRAENEYKKAKKHEEDALNELHQLEAEKVDLEEELAELDAQLQHLDAEEEKFWEERNEFTLELNKFQSERDRLNNQYEFDSKQLQRFQRANVYNDFFVIGYDGYFATINRLRLGRLPDRSVEWSEINAAWGQALLLLVTVAEKLKFEFYGFELKPMGSTSTITQTIISSSQKEPKKKVHELYTTGDFSLGMSLFNRKFDAAMIAFLECLRQLMVHAQKTEVIGPKGQKVTCPDIPFAIDKDMIGDSSIKLGSFSQEVQWTKACKSTLICCKFILAHASNVTELAHHTEE